MLVIGQISVGMQSGCLFIWGPAKLQKCLKSILDKESTKKLFLDEMYQTQSLLLNFIPFRTRILINFMHFGHLDVRLLTMDTTAWLSQ